MSPHRSRPLVSVNFTRPIDTGKLNNNWNPIIYVFVFTSFLQNFILLSDEHAGIPTGLLTPPPSKEKRISPSTSKSSDESDGEPARKKLKFPDFKLVCKQDLSKKPWLKKKVCAVGCKYFQSNLHNLNVLFILFFK